MQRTVDVGIGTRLWAEYVPPTGPSPGRPVLLVADADSSGLSWPDELLTALAAHHPVIRYDHRDSGRSTWSEDDPEYDAGDLAADALAVLDAFAVPRAHLVGMGMGGLLGQLVLLDRPERVRTATLVCTAPLGPRTGLPGPSEALRRLWAELDDPRDTAGELAWRVEHWRALNGAGTPFDPAEFRAREQRVIAHTGHAETAGAHTRMAADPLLRGAELASVGVPVLVVEAADDPVYPPPNGAALAAAVPAARLVRIPGMGHAIPRAAVPALAAAILSLTRGRSPARA